MESQSRAREIENYIPSRSFGKQNQCGATLGDKPPATLPFLRRSCCLYCTATLVALPAGYRCLIKGLTNCLLLQCKPEATKFEDERQASQCSRSVLCVNEVACDGRRSHSVSSTIVDRIARRVLHHLLLAVSCGSARQQNYFTPHRIMLEKCRLAD